MAHKPQIRIPATYMRGGTSKGVFFRLQDLPDAAQMPGAARDALLLRVIGSPDPYGKQIDGMGGATSSTSKTVIIDKSSKPDHDVDYLFGQVSIDKPFVDWSGNCGNLSAAVGPFAISAGLVEANRIPRDGVATVRIWQANIGKTIIAHVPMTGGAVQETGDFELDGVTFPAAEVQLEFMDPAADEDGAGGSMFPTGNLVDDLEVPGVGTLKATMINAGIPTIFVNAEAIGYKGTELQDAINSDEKALAMFETIRAHGALRMGLIKHLDEIAKRQHTPKIAFVAKPADYVSSSGKQIGSDDVDLLVRAMSMGKLHHAMMGTAAVAIGTAAAIPGTLVNLAAGGGEREAVRFGHPSGTLRVGAEAAVVGGEWVVRKAVMSRSARVLMEGGLGCSGWQKRSGAGPMRAVRHGHLARPVELARLRTGYNPRAIEKHSTVRSGSL
ncbi:2-methylaconitate cis-trans isomerase PrpF [Paraburkholderia kirstenboschensis]|uniref:2-methylaconitate cis-trans isomerase PrpF n=1 Tax=Paraburkholderia kirstenboschensis TaxID=1245436 RepID=UPI000A9D9DB4|nr:2-methylaconitate cis-trans isomerase PrpF [Paraburkholderia kirstenboschensis]